MNRTDFFRVTRGILALMLLIGVASCGTIIPELQVQYTLPPPSDELRGRAVSLTIQDRRADTSILGRGAREDFKGFSNSVSLSIVDAGQKGLNVGIFQVPALMREALERRLARLGVEVLSDTGPGVPGLVIILREFSLDLVGREWSAKMGYEAKLTGAKGGVVTQSVNGQASRYKVVGRDAADDLMSEIFTDMVNALNVQRLFEQAGITLGH